MRPFRGPAILIEFVPYAMRAVGGTGYFAIAELPAAQGTEVAPQRGAGPLGLPAEAMGALGHARHFSTMKVSAVNDLIFLPMKLLRAISAAFCSAALRDGPLALAKGVRLEKTSTTKTLS
jgi:hypothetical protein